MSHKYLHLCISSGYAFVSCSNRLLRKALGNKSSIRLVILLYHHIPDECKRLFATQMDCLQANANVVDLTADPMPLRPGLNVGITFDDALKSAFRNAVPQLLARNLPCLIFVPTGYLGKRPEWIKDPHHISYQDQVISTDDVAYLSQNGIAIGSHTVNHIKLTKANPDIQRSEMAVSKQQLEQITGKHVNALAFPYGDFGESTLELSKSMGYRAAFGSIPEPLELQSFLMPRINVSPCESTASFTLKFKGYYSWQGAAIRFKRRILAKTS